MSVQRLDAPRLRLRVAATDPPVTEGWRSFGRFELCPRPDAGYPVALPAARLLLEQTDATDPSAPTDGVYERLGSAPQGRETRTASGVLVVLVDNADLTREAAFNRWYDEVHVPDVLAPGTFYRATRFRALDSSPLAHYLAIYETDAPDPVAAHQAVAAKSDPDRMWDAIVPIHVASYRSI